MLIPKVEPRISQYLQFLKPRRYREIEALRFEAFETDKTFRQPPEGAEWKKISVPYAYGKAWHCSWFRASFRCPEGASPGLFLRVLPNADSLVFIDGKPRGAFNPFHKKIKAPAGGGEHTLYLEAYAGHPYPGCHPFEGERIMLTLGRQIPGYPNTFEGGALVERVEAVYSLYYDVKCLFELAAALDADSLRKARILKGLYDALGGIPFAAEGAALEKAAEQAARAIRPLLEAKNGPTVPEIHLVGHAHIDHAWLWHIGETERKIARTYSNMAALAEEYPEFVFIQSQPAQLEIIKNEYPEIFAAVQEAYRKGNWEPNGGMWVEADCNISGGESLIRQFLVGKAANKEMLGAESDTLWLPDVFGYAAALPQILAGCGIRYFVTSKISWNDTTRFPYDTFIWRGLDGSAVKTHYISSRAYGYNGKVSPGSLAGLWGDIQHKEIQGAAINSVGEGDGGGGTTRGDLEMARRLGDLEGAPRSAWKKVSAALDAIFGGSDAWPEWRGELYLELHRGTYTTQAKTKAFNRRLEFALRHTELLFAVAAGEGWAPYPRDILLGFWKKLLTNQFHDIIPGSSIGRVYAEAEEEYQKIEAGLAEMTGALRRQIGASLGGGLVLFNDLSWEREDPAVLSLSLPDTGAVLMGTASGEVYPLQAYRDLDGKEKLLCTPRLPPLGWAHFTLGRGTGTARAPSASFTFTGETLETPFYLVRFDAAGRIAGLFDRRRKVELVAPEGRFNRLIGAQDVPVLWEAWDIDADWTRFAEDEDRLLSTEVNAGPVAFRLRRAYAVGASSSLVQDTVFYARNPRIDFETKVDWRETRRLLKAGFDTAIDAAQVRCEVQYGHLVRNTHKNLPQDRAKFEICAHKWAALEEEGGGIALLNNGKYGHDAAGGHLGLTLLRSPIAPDPGADQGEQRFTYSLLPFTGSFGEAGIVRAGYELNAPAAAEVSADSPAPASGQGRGEYSFFTVEGDAVVVESVKAPEAASGSPEGSVVIRLYESLGGRAAAALRFSREPVSAWATDMLETNPRGLALAGNELALDFRAFEIKTLLVRFV
ncbi:MAG: glycosyl hydrolase-related protein [Spirochaetaceae bacterium]|jgi:alpha-mannosidase|nr:glycosyl hydrolase-related protein [Spirochaetaceae bacterium]